MLQASATLAGGTTCTFRRIWNSGSGKSACNAFFQNFEILGPLATSVSPAVVIRSEQSQTAPVLANGNAIRLQLLQKQKTTNIFIKTGTILAGTSSGVAVFGSMSDNVLGNDAARGGQQTDPKQL